MSSRVRTSKIVSVVRQLTRPHRRVNVYDVTNAIVQNHTTADRIMVRRSLETAVNSGKLKRIGSNFVLAETDSLVNTWLPRGCPDIILQRRRRSPHKYRRIRRRSRKTRSSTRRRRSRKIRKKPTFKHPLKYFEKPDRKPDIREKPKNKIKKVRKKVFKSQKRRLNKFVMKKHSQRRY